MKAYRPREHRAPETATQWQEISRHADLGEAERRLRHLVMAPIY